MDENKLSIVLDLYKKDCITKEEAFALLQITIVEKIQPIAIEPYTPYREPFNPYGPVITYASNETANKEKLQPYIK